MKVVLAHKYFYRGGGTATYLFALMPELEKRGHECIPFTVAYDQTVPSKYSRYFVSPVAGSSQTHLKDMKKTPWLMLKLLARATWSLEAYRKALQLCDELKPDIAYVHNLYSYMSPSPIAAFKKRGVPVVMRVSDASLLCPAYTGWLHGEVCVHCARNGPWRGLRYRCHKGSLSSTAARALSAAVHRWLRIYDSVDTFVTPSQFMAELLASGGYNHKPVVCIPSFYPSRCDLNGQVEGDYVLYFGRIAPYKGLATLIRAFIEVGRGYRLLLAGTDVDGETDRLRRLAVNVDSGAIEFAGPQDREDLDELVRRCLFTVIPSEWAENSPMSVLEAFAHGKPVIGSDIGGIPEQVAEGAGLLFPPGDVQALAERMSVLLASAELRREMGQAAWHRVRTRFSPERHLDRLERVFGDIHRCC